MQDLADLQAALDALQPPAKRLPLLLCQQCWDGCCISSALHVKTAPSLMIMVLGACPCMLSVSSVDDGHKRFTGSLYAAKTYEIHSGTAFLLRTWYGSGEA